MKTTLELTQELRYLLKLITQLEQMGDFIRKDDILTNIRWSAATISEKILSNTRGFQNSRNKCWWRFAISTYYGYNELMKIKNKWSLADLRAFADGARNRARTIPDKRKEKNKNACRVKHYDY